MLTHEQFYNWYNNNFNSTTLYKVYRKGFLLEIGYYSRVRMGTLESSVCILKNVTFIKKQNQVSSFRFEFEDKIDETYQLIPVQFNDIILLASSIALVSNTLGQDEGYNKEYGLKMINEYAETIRSLCVQKTITTLNRV